MLHSNLVSLASTAIMLLAPYAAAQSPTPIPLGPNTRLHCYKDVSPLVSEASYQWASDGWCQQQCGYKNHSVMAMVGGSTCYCGDIIPSLDKVVPDSNCDTPCNGFGDRKCGGIGFYQVWLTGLTGDVKTAANGSDTADSTSSTSSSATPVIMTVGETVIVTAPSSPEGKGGPSKIGIAVGVIVALVVVGTAVGAAVFFLKQRRRKAMQEEARRTAAIAEFTKSKVSETSSTTDQRLDASFISSHRRESIGSIADEMDFSRRILQVRNPDHRASNASGFA